MPVGLRESLPRFSGRLAFARAFHQLLQLAFDGGVADMLILHNAVGIDRERVRNSGNTKKSCHRPGKSPVASLQPSHPVIVDELLPLLFIRVETDAEYYQGLPLKFLRYVFYMRQSLAARCAPRSPEIDQNDFSLYIIDRDFPSIDRGD